MSVEPFKVAFCNGTILTIAPRDHFSRFFFSNIFQSTGGSVAMAAEGSGQVLGMLRSSWLVALSWLSSMAQKRLDSNVVCWSSVAQLQFGVHH